jgi:hypothetical protein
MKAVGTSPISPVIKSADDAKYHYDVDVELLWITRWETIDFFRNPHQTLDNDNWRLSQKDLPGASSKVDTIHS